VSDQDRAYLRPPRAAELAQNQDDLDDLPDLPDNVPYNDIRYADSARMGAIDVDGDALSDFEGTGDVYDRGFLLENSGGFTQGGSSTPVNGYLGDLFPKMNRHLVDVLGHFDVSDSLTISAEGKYVRSQAFSVSQPTYDFYLLMTPDNPFMPDSIRDAIVPGAAAAFFEDPDTPDGVMLTRDNYDLGVNGEDTLRETLRGVLAANGEISDRLSYEASYVYGETKSRILSRNNRVLDLWLAAIDVVEDGSGQPVCRSSLDPDADESLAGCVPYNIFGDGVRDPDAPDFVNVDSVSHTKVTQQVVSGSLSGDFGSLMEMPGGSIGFAVGAEYRRETSDSLPLRAASTSRKSSPRSTCRYSTRRHSRNACHLVPRSARPITALSVRPAPGRSMRCMRRSARCDFVAHTRRQSARRTSTNSSRPRALSSTSSSTPATSTSSTTAPARVKRTALRC
jgi:hypothetical protein